MREWLPAAEGMRVWVQLQQFHEDHGEPWPALLLHPSWYFPRFLPFLKERVFCPCWRVESGRNELLRCVPRALLPADALPPHVRSGGGEDSSRSSGSSSAGASAASGGSREHPAWLDPSEGEGRRLLGSAGEPGAVVVHMLLTEAGWRHEAAVFKERLCHLQWWVTCRVSERCDLFIFYLLPSKLMAWNSEDDGDFINARKIGWSKGQELNI